MTDQTYLRALLRAVGIKKHGETWKIRLAEDLGYSRAMVTLWDKGDREIGHRAARDLEKLAKRLGIKKCDIVV